MINQIIFHNRTNSSTICANLNKARAKHIERTQKSNKTGHRKAFKKEIMVTTNTSYISKSILGRMLQNIKNKLEGVGLMS